MGKGGRGGERSLKWGKLYENALNIKKTGAKNPNNMLRAA